MKVTDVSFHEYENRNMKAFAKVTFDDTLVVTGVKIMDGSNGLFMAWPSQLNKDDKWHDIVYATDQDKRREINDEVMRLYRAFKGDDEEKEEPEDDDDDLPF